MSRYIIDSWAWMEYLNGSELGSKAKQTIENEEIFTSMVSLAEVVSKVTRSGGESDVAFNSIVSLSKIISGDAGFAKNAGLLHATVKKTKPNFSLADAFVLQAAKSLNARVLTGDPDFKGVKEAEMLK